MEVLTMNEVFVCIGCGKIGDKEDLSFYKATIVDNEVMNKIIEANKLGVLKCPHCGSPDVFYSRPDAPIGVFSPEQSFIESAQDKIGVHTKPTHIDMAKIQVIGRELTKEEYLSISPDLVVATPKPIVKENKNTQEPVRIDTMVRFKNKCDLCEMLFECKVDGSTRCPKCLKKLVQ
jgi:hypothetical protein